jgi:hypothetical protein
MGEFDSPCGHATTKTRRKKMARITLDTLSEEYRVNDTPGYQVDVKVEENTLKHECSSFTHDLSVRVYWNPIPWTPEEPDIDAYHFTFTYDSGDYKHGELRWTGGFERVHAPTRKALAVAVFRTSSAIRNEKKKEQIPADTSAA